MGCTGFLNNSSPRAITVVRRGALHGRDILLASALPDLGNNIRRLLVIQFGVNLRNRHRTMA